MTMVEERVTKLEGAYEQVDARLGDLRSEMRDLRGEMGALRTEMRGEMRDLRTEMGALRTEVNNKFNILVMVIATGGAAIAGSLVALALRV